MMKIGTYYYPEQWPREQWERDFDHIESMGLRIVHMGEFAWFSMEPQEGQFRLDWLSEAVEMAAKRKLDVILCTPTAVPPIWLEEKHPEIFLQDEHGTPLRHGGRRHCNPTSPAYQDATRRIVSALADRFGKHPSVIGWQIDNEYSGPFGQNDYTHQAFRDWLKRKYETIEKLNAAWGTQFWNTYYTDWKQIQFPATRDPKYGNPHQALDASRFWSQAYAAYNRIQSDILKAAMGPAPAGTPAPFITTNFMPFHLDCDPGDMAPDFNLMSWDAYPVTGWARAATSEHFRIADPSYIGLIHDQMASYHGRWAQMELQPGQVNWSGYPVLLYPGTVRLWLWTAFAHGAEFVTTYRFRQPRFGIELWHHGLVGPDGVTPTVGGREFMQTIDEMKRLATAAAAPASGAAGASPALAAPPATPKARAAKPAAHEAAAAHAHPAEAPTVGLLFDFEQLWYYQSLPQARRWDQPRFLRMWYSALMRLGLRVKVLQPNRPLPHDLPLIVAPGVQMVDDALVGEFSSYANSGGHLVLTCRTGIMDRNGQLFEGPLGKPILPLIGGTIDAYDSLPEETYGHVDLDGKKYQWGVWGDLVFAETAKPIAKYADQFYVDAIAVMQNKVGSGAVTYCGVYGEQSFLDALVERLAMQLKLPITILPPRVHMVQRGRFKVLLNYEDQPVDAPAGKAAHFLVGTRKVDPAGVAVWEE